MAPDGVPGFPADGRLDPEVISLFHRLNNQLGVVLANSELLESKLADAAQRERASQIVTGALEAIGTVQHLKRVVGLTPADGSRTGN